MPSKPSQKTSSTSTSSTTSRRKKAATPAVPAPRKLALEKRSLHPRNRHRGRYDFAALVKVHPTLSNYLIVNPFDAAERTIDFANPDAVMALNAALLKSFYGVESWQVPPGYLCPPIPGRADYVHHAADLLAAEYDGVIPRGAAIRVLDIGVGANCIYPLIGHAEYAWRFVGTDVDAAAIRAAQDIVDHNVGLAEAISFRRQTSAQKIFAGIIQPDEFFDFVLCNPPFHASAHEAELGALRKWKNLGRTDNAKSANAKPALNFGGQAAELWCEGGEAGFVGRMVTESAHWRKQVGWFSALVSQEKNLPAIYTALRGVSARRVETIDMAQGQKKSRIVAWRF